MSDQKIVPFLCDQGMVVWQNDYDKLRSVLQSIEHILLRKSERVFGFTSCEDEILRIVVAALRQYS